MIKEHIYENRTNTSVAVVLPSEDGHSASQIVFGPYGRLELTYPGLDNYVPAKLTKICHLSGKLLGLIDTAVEVVNIVADEVKEVIVEPTVEVTIEKVEAVVENAEATVEAVVEKVEEAIDKAEAIVEPVVEKVEDAVKAVETKVKKAKK